MRKKYISLMMGLNADTNLLMTTIAKVPVTSAADDTRHLARRASGPRLQRSQPASDTERMRARQPAQRRH